MDRQCSGYVRDQETEDQAVENPNPCVGRAELPVREAEEEWEPENKNGNRTEETDGGIYPF